MNVGTWMGLAQDVSVEHEELELAGLDQFEDFRVGDGHAVVLGVNGDVEPSTRFGAHRIPQLGEIDMQVARGRLWMILPGLEALRPRCAEADANGAGGSKAGDKRTAIEDHR